MHYKKILIALICAISLVFLAQGCNTLQGAGQDIEEAGESVQDAAD